MKKHANVMAIRKATLEDAEAIAQVYNYYITNSVSTFEEEVLSTSDMASRIQSVSEKYIWLVGIVSNEVIGYAYAGEWKSRSAYRFTVETSIYLHPSVGGNGYGRQLYAELLEQVEQLGYKSLIGGISLPNEASVRLHESLGFEKIGHFVKVGNKFNQWIDVGYWEKINE